MLRGRVVRAAAARLDLPSARQDDDSTLKGRPVGGRASDRVYLRLAAS